MYPIHSHILAATTNTKKVNKIVNWFSIFVFYSILHFVQFQATNAIEMYALCSRSWFMASVCGLIFDMKQSDHRDSIPFLIGRLLHIETHNVFFFKKNTIRCIHRFLGSHRRSTTINFFFLRSLVFDRRKFYDFITTLWNALRFLFFPPLLSGGKKK